MTAAAAQPTRSGPTLADRHDVLLLDLDGTVYLGGAVIDHVAAVLAAAADRGARSIYVTNNASRPPAEVAKALQDMGIPATGHDVLTSPEVACEMLAAAHPAGSKVLVVGAAWLAEAVVQAGLEPVRLAEDAPVAVVQGHSPDTGWRELAEACIALRSGADWVACNTDSTLPTDRGLLPGTGSMVAALVTATGLAPRVAGKPARPLLDAAIHRAGALHPLVVGDRLDTDIEAAVAAALPSLLVLTGVSTAADLLGASPARRPSHVSLDLRGLVDLSRVVELGAPDAAGSWTVDAGTLRGGTAGDDAGVLAALAALAAVAWPARAGTTFQAGDHEAEQAFARLSLPG